MSASRVKRKNCLYNSGNLQLAIQEVGDNTISVWNASKKFKIPYQTLKEKIDGTHNGKIGVSTILSAEDESELAEWIRERAKRAFGVEKKELLEAASNIAIKRGGKQFGPKGLQ